MVLRVVVAEDAYLVREGMQRVLEKDAEVQLVGVCQDLPGAFTTVEAQAPDVVVTDIRMPPSHQDEGIQLAARLRANHPQVGVVVLSQFDEPEYAVRLLE